VANASSVNQRKKVNKYELGDNSYSPTDPSKSMIDRKMR